MRLDRHLRLALQSAGCAFLALFGMPLAQAEDSSDTSVDKRTAVDTELRLRTQDKINDAARKNSGNATWNIDKIPASGFTTSRQYDTLLAPDAPLRVRWALPMKDMKIRRVILPPESSGVKYLLVETVQHDLIAFRQDNGEALWWVKTPAEIFGDIHIGKLSVIFTCAGRFVRLEKNSGDLVCNVDLPFAPAAGPASIEEDEKTVMFFISGMDRSVYAFDIVNETWPPKGNQANIDNQELAVTLHHYRQIWKFIADNIVSTTPVLSDTHLVFGSWGNHAYGVDLTGDYGSGKPDDVWQFRTRGGIEAAGVVDGPSILLPSTDGNLYSLNRNGGSLAWRYIAPDALFFSPQLLSDKEADSVYVLQRSGRNGPLIAIDRMSGDGIWQHDTGIKTVGSMALDSHNAKLRASALIQTTAGTIDCVRISAPDARNPDQKKKDDAEQQLRRASVAWSLPVGNFSLFAANNYLGQVFCATADGSAICVLEENK